jgi:hypothetical protein
MLYRGKPLLFRASCQDEKDQWVETLRRIIKFDSASHLAPLSTFGLIRRRVRGVYVDPTTQSVVAALICSNFLVNIIQAQTGDKMESILEMVDIFFTALFTLELCVNLIAMLVAEFFSDPWNYFDSVVVAVALVTLAVPDLPGGSTLKLMRTFRVFRLFKRYDIRVHRCVHTLGYIASDRAIFSRRIPSLKRLVTSIFGAIPAMANAYVLMTILTSIYAILCVRFFGVLGGEQVPFPSCIVKHIFYLEACMRQIGISQSMLPLSRSLNFFFDHRPSFLETSFCPCSPSGKS